MPFKAMIYAATGRYWTIQWHAEAPPAPPESGTWLLVEHSIPGWFSHSSGLSWTPLPYSDPVTGRAHRWPHPKSARQACRELYTRHGPLEAFHIYCHPFTGQPQAHLIVV